ncbi:MAG TPA: carbohydrate ABC transporter permease [Mycobacteriales bacterium]|nr:carbohydrate ABC transporter permease [Mycobacteriales bacterium]
MTAARSVPSPVRSLGSKTALHLFLGVSALLMIYPFIWMIITALKTVHQSLYDPLGVVPHPATLSNFPDAWHSLPFGEAYWNSFYICVLVVAGTLLTGAMAAYGFGRVTFRGSKVLFMLFLATQMVPAQVTLIPLYVELSKFGWIDSHLALIVPGMVNPFAVFLIRQFVKSVPIELEEAALLDGANRWRIFWHVVLPNIRPGLVAVGIVVALNSWNSFLYPLIFLNSTRLFTLPLLLAQFRGQFGGVNYPLVMAGSAITIAPMVIAFLIGQRKILNSMAMSGLGGR